MATESPVRLIGSTGARNWPLNKDSAAFTSSTGNLSAQELGLLLEGQKLHGNTQYSGPSRSGSAPPTMEASAINNLIGQRSLGIGSSLENLSNAIESCEVEEQLRADPAYLEYYCSNVNLNPRLPPPLISRENRRLAHHIVGSNNWKMHAFDDSTKVSLFSSRPVLSTHKEEPEDDRSPRLGSNDATDSSSGFVSEQFTSPLKGRHKSLVDLIQEDFPRTPSPVYTSQSRAASHGVTEEAASADGCVNILQGSPNKMANLSELNTATVGVQAYTHIPGVHSSASVPKNDHSAGSPCSSSSEVTVGSHPILKGESHSADADVNSGVAVPETGTVESEMKNLKICSDGHKMQLARQHPPQNALHPRGFSSQVQTGLPQIVPLGARRSHIAVDHISNGQPKSSSLEVQPILQSTGIAPPLYGTAAAFGAPYYPNLQTSSLFTPQYNMGGYTLNASPIPPSITAYPPHIAIPVPLDGSAGANFNARTSGIPTVGNISPGVDYQHFYKLYGQLGVAMQPSFPDPFYMPYFQQPSPDTYAGVGQYDPTVLRGNIIGSPPDNHDPQKGPSSTAYSPTQRPQFLRTGGVHTPNARNGANGSPNYYGSPPNIGVLVQYPTSPLASPVFQGSPVAGTNSPGRRTDHTRLPFGSGRNVGPCSGWQGQRGREKVDDPKYSFLEELKSSKARRFELSDIAGRIVEFSADQHGSRFIQQKLEICSVKDKASVFGEILPHASTLMTDVFGNYVIQKFFEHGSQEQRKELANKLTGNILPLSLQMYGCRVIQKALEFIDIDQKTELVLELDGHVMRCVRDQNGNHVIQKCIECVPTEKIGFIISAFRGQVATLSTHPYGCRVIQRVLEHCTDELQSQSIVDEILQSACVLAQDQYGNYVTQHVLERGKPHERSQIINKLAGQIVQMSQHKFASNVIEKCLEHGNTEEREIVIEEIVGQTEGNDNLLTMMKDQFANYVVQKILETCSDRQREVLLNHIRVHLQALKKYTYGKHIVARVEQLFDEETNATES